ncbi:probable tRNA (uracil-O(2)-)-methyltransferase [Eurytemora carolleeae]|uniref:probable tRNA (uracil-O(2)-)-methyltransferase n=1 Tax=Eurytemora carolleeae TaxID=1294199 RepID=UPI000C782C1E|nr:probable tRNA (uracil-O(2)-)-methyltransferase [Eurytemora carolleeae]XP_023321071.1 probable tRNA (uracil-O(2)-)-methyltransferase [Eurytemora carolleeae]|eukprot:XP_023321069.1 probable tRNA (uracil-O(2)-)-methyltransferase [Eurytemora affinis]
MNNDLKKPTVLEHQDFWVPLAHCNVEEITKDQWKKACDIIIDKPQSLDKRVAGQVLLGADTFPYLELGEELILNLEKEKTWQNIQNLLNQKRQNTAGQTEDKCDIVFKLQKLVSRNDLKFQDFHRILVCSEFKAVFIPIAEDSVPYRLTYRNEGCELSVSKGLKDQQKVWLESRLFPRFVSWLQDTLSNLQPSLRLVDLEEYCREYSRLKSKYAGDLISNWKETSDAEKSIHEDIGIAAYLTCIWGQKKISFVDLGCGNGLLVYILNSEGHKGIGYDLRRRGIWDWFPTKPELREEPIIPGVETRFPGIDWILGNHSDELTPWIPVFACLSGPNTCYWVLPCCTFDFTTKYQRRNAGDSIFRDYLNFVMEIGCLAGFRVEEDKMRIPSTKRICLVGKPNDTNYEERKQKVLDFVEEKSRGFKPREKVEKVRNCTKIGNEIVTNIVNIVVNLCLETNQELIKESGETWNSGGELSFPQIVQRLQDNKIDLSKLKSECGGLQTLFRNHPSIFQVQQGTVRLRVPGTLAIKKKNAKIKSKDCWFYLNHPDGCYDSTESCTWIHPSPVLPS